MVVKHPSQHYGADNSAFMNEFEKLKQGAFDKAKEEQTKKSIIKA